MANKTILVTGSTGWLGGKLCEALVARGITVVGLARRDTEVAGVMSVRADLATGAGLEKLEGLEFDCCAHLAAVAGWRQLPVEDSWTTWTTNSTRGDGSAKRRRPPTNI